ncbi:MAG TPA: DUF2723 domain-containing protein [Candidatus Tyrphobacter sp.]
MDYLAYARMLHGGYHTVRTAHRHRHRFVVALAFLVPMLTYVFSISHDVAARDLAEMQGVPYLLGIPHATGYPLFVLLGWVFSHAIAIDSLAYRMNLFGALCMSLTCAVGVITAIRIGVGPVTSLGAFLCFAWARIVWFHGAQADTQDLALLFQTTTFFYLAGWLKHQRTRDVVGAFAAWGAALAVHPIAIWLLPCVLVALAARAKHVTISNVGAGIAIFILILGCYAYLPLRSSALERQPVDAVQMLAPPAARVYWDANAPSTQAGFVNEVTGSSFGATSLWAGIVDPRNWIGYLGTLYRTIHDGFDVVFIGVMALGILLLLHRRTAICIMLLVGAISVTFTATALASAEGDPTRYLMLLMWIAALLAGAVTVEFTWTVDPRRMLWALVLLGNALYLGIANHAVSGEQRSVSNRPLIAWVAQSVPQHAIVVTPWADATTLAYAAYADGSLSGRTIVAAHPLAIASQYAAWSAREPVYVVTSAAKPLNDPRFRAIGGPAAGHALFEFIAAR